MKKSMIIYVQGSYDFAQDRIRDFLPNLKRFKKAVRMVIVLLRSGGILDTHKREFIDPVDLGKFKKNLNRKCFEQRNF